MVDIAEKTPDELAIDEFKSMGLFMKNHPLSKYVSLFERFEIKDSSFVKNVLKNGSHQIKIAGVIVKKDARMSQKGRFITLVLSDLNGIFEVTIFSEEILRDYANLINVEDVVIVTADVMKDSGGIRITAKAFTSPEELVHGANFNLTIYPKNTVELKQIVEVLKSKENSDKRNSTITICLQHEDSFMTKVKLPKIFYLENEDVNLLTKELEEA